jgi:2-desacetyl-2-hydroxyethyl bacteriochlorophyllide A dehydrogenase
MLQLKDHMKILECITPGKLEYRAEEMPPLTEGNSVVKIKRIGICGTDLHAYEGTQPFFNYPRILGHEIAGELVAFDEAPGFEIGDPVTFIPYFSCGKCFACISDKANCCVNMEVCGVHIQGGMREYLSVPSYSLVHGGGLSYDELALVEPLAIGAHGVRRADICKGESVFVIGAGPIGLGIMEFVRIAGGRVIGMDINRNRLAFCKEKLKVEDLVDGNSDDIKTQLEKITNGDMPSVIFDATGSIAAINNAFQYMAHGGRYVLVGLQRNGISFSHPEFHKREGTLMSSRNATRANFEYVIRCIKDRQIDPLKFITHRVRFDQIADEFQNWLAPDSGVLKAMVQLD